MTMMTSPPPFMESPMPTTKVAVSCGGNPLLSPPPQGTEPISTTEEELQGETTPDSTTKETGGGNHLLSPPAEGTLMAPSITTTSSFTTGEATPNFTAKKPLSTVTPGRLTRKGSLVNSRKYQWPPPKPDSSFMTNSEPTRSDSSKALSGKTPSSFPSSSSSSLRSSGSSGDLIRASTRSRRIPPSPSVQQGGGGGGELSWVGIGVGVTLSSPLSVPNTCPPGLTSTVPRGNTIVSKIPSLALGSFEDDSNKDNSSNNDNEGSSRPTDDNEGSSRPTGDKEGSALPTDHYERSSRSIDDNEGSSRPTDDFEGSSRSTNDYEGSSRPTDDTEDFVGSTESPGNIAKGRVNLESPSRLRAQLTRASPGTVKARLKTFSPKKSPKTPTEGRQLLSSSGSPASGSTTPTRSLGKRTPSKRLKNRWPPVTKKQADERKQKEKIKITAEIRQVKKLSTTSVQAARSRFEKRSLSLPGISSLPFGGGGVGDDENKNNSSKDDGRRKGGLNGYKAVSDRHVVKPDQVKTTLSKFENLSVSEHEKRSSSRPIGVGVGLSVSEHGGGASGGYIPKFKMAKKDSFRRSDHSVSSHSSSMHPISERDDKIPSSTARSSAPARRRTNYCIRYEGPTLLPLKDVYGDDNDRTSRKMTAEEKGSNDDEVDDAKQQNPSTTLEGYDDFDDFYSDGEESLKGDEIFSGGARPDVWFAPHDPNGNWRVKRVWNDELADEMEIEHEVPAADLMKSISELLGLPDDLLENYNNNSNNDSSDSSDDKPFAMKMVFDIGGEIVEDETDLEKSFSLLKINDEIGNILQNTSYEDYVEESECSDEFDSRRTTNKAVYSIGEEENEDYDDPNVKMIYGVDHGFDESSNDLNHRRMHPAQGATHSTKMVYGDGIGEGFDESFNDLSHRKIIGQSSTATPGARPKMAYGYVDGAGLGFDDSFNDLSHRKVMGQSSTSAPGARPKMAYGYGDGAGSGFDDSFNDLSHRKVAVQSTTTHPLDGARMAYGYGDDSGFDDSFNDLHHRKVPVQSTTTQASPGAKMAYGNSDGAEAHFDDSFNDLNHRKLVPTEAMPAHAKMAFGGGSEEGFDDSFNDLDHRKIAPTETRPTHATMSYGAAIEEGFDDSFNDLNNRKVVPTETQPAHSKMSYGDGIGQEFDDSFNDLGNRKIQSTQTSSVESHDSGNKSDSESGLIAPTAKTQEISTDNGSRSDSESDLIAPIAKTQEEPSDQGNAVSSSSPDLEVSFRSVGSHSNRELWFNDDAMSPRTPKKPVVRSRSLLYEDAARRKYLDSIQVESLDSGNEELEASETMSNCPKSPKSPKSPRSPKIQKERAQDRELWFNDESLSPKPSPVPSPVRGRRTIGIGDRRSSLRGCKREDFVALRSSSLSDNMGRTMQKTQSKSLSSSDRTKSGFANASWDMDHEGSARKYYKGRVEPTQQARKQDDANSRPHVPPWKKKVESPLPAKEKPKVKLWFET